MHAFRLYGIEKPGALLVIMSTAMGTSNNFPLHKIPIIQFCSFRSSDRHYHGHCASFHRQAPLRFQNGCLFKNDFILIRFLLDALHYAYFIFSGLFKSIASFNQRLLDDVYLRSHFTRENLHSVMQRNVQRILGTSLGLLLSAILLMIPFTPLQTIGIISILYAAFEGFINRNYAIASFLLPRCPYYYQILHDSKSLVIF